MAFVCTCEYGYFRLLDQMVPAKPVYFRTAVTRRFYGFIGTFRSGHQRYMYP